MLIGTIGSVRRAQVRGGGVIVLHADTPDEVQVEWWLGGDDRWYRPEREITTRQHLVRNSPIVQTSVRVPTGDAIATCFAAVQGPRELVVMDLENRSKLPFAIAVVLRGPGVRDVTVQGTQVKVGGLSLLSLGRAPMKAAAVPAGEDVAEVVMSGRATDVMPTVSGNAEVALILPVTHATTLRMAFLIGASSSAAFAGSPVVSSLPDVHTMANGWGVHLDRGPFFKLPDGELATNFTQALGALLLAAEPATASASTPVAEVAILAEALVLSGFTAEAGALLEDVGFAQGSKGRICDAGSLAFGASEEAVTAVVLRSVATHASLSGDALFAQTMAPMVAGGLEFLAKRASKSAELAQYLSIAPAVARLFEVADDQRAAVQCQALWERNGSPTFVVTLPLPPLPALGLGGTLVPEDSYRVAAIVRSTIERFAIADPNDSDAVDLVSDFDPGWKGGKVDVRGIPTRAGSLSYSVRWHGQRPAILWDVDPEEGGGWPELRLRCASLDPTWVGEGLKGEALLQQSAAR